MRLCECGRKHCAKGLCSRCYSKEHHQRSEVKKRERIRKLVKYRTNKDFREVQKSRSLNCKNKNKEVYAQKKKEYYRNNIEDERARSFVKNILIRGN